MIPNFDKIKVVTSWNRQLLDVFWLLLKIINENNVGRKYFLMKVLEENNKKQTTIYWKYQNHMTPTNNPGLQHSRQNRHNSIDSIEIRKNLVSIILSPQFAPTTRFLKTQCKTQYIWNTKHGLLTLIMQT